MKTIGTKNIFKLLSVIIAFIIIFRLPNSSLGVLLLKDFCIIYHAIGMLMCVYSIDNSLSLAQKLEAKEYKILLVFITINMMIIYLKPFQYIWGYIEALTKHIKRTLYTRYGR